MHAKDLLAAHERIKPHVHHTPVFTSTLLDELSGAQLFFKCENFQRMGAFKIRGAVNAVLQLPEERKARGVLTHSSGNFAQALALAARSADIPAYIVMPSDAPAVKTKAVKEYGGKVTPCAPTPEAREAAAHKLALKTGAAFIHPFNDEKVIAGQATAAMELLDTYPGLQYLFVPVGGGGLISGSALAAHFFGNHCEVFGGEPLEADDAYRSLESGSIQTNKSANTIADGLRTHLGDITFAIIKEHVRAVIRVNEEEIVSAMRLLWERLKIVVEPSGAVAFAALLKERETFRDKKVGILISGGNVDLSALPF